MHLFEAYRALEFFQANPPMPGSQAAIAWWELGREVFFIRHGVYPVEDLCLIALMTALATTTSTSSG